MKNLILATLIISIFCFSDCKKNTIDSNGLPKATQEGKNTLGFLLNGQPWTPKGIRGTGNLSIDLDPGIGNGILGINAYNFEPVNSEQFQIGLADSINFVTAPQIFTINRLRLAHISFMNFDCGDYFSGFNTVTTEGSLTITKLDRTNRIISGRFEATLTKSGLGCGTIKITEGRFDMKF